ncbi:MAG: hypothetical protein WC822_02335 [Candidatus Paceibacterota bacterium]|jgi:hypothetical protein
MARWIDSQMQGSPFPTPVSSQILGSLSDVLTGALPVVKEYKRQKTAKTPLGEFLGIKTKEELPVHLQPLFSTPVGRLKDVADMMGQSFGTLLRNPVQQPTMNIQYDPTTGQFSLGNMAGTPTSQPQGTMVDALKDTPSGPAPTPGASPAAQFLASKGLMRPENMMGMASMPPQRMSMPSPMRPQMPQMPQAQGSNSIPIPVKPGQIPGILQKQWANELQNKAIKLRQGIETRLLAQAGTQQEKLLLQTIKASIDPYLSINFDQLPEETRLQMEEAVKQGSAMLNRMTKARAGGASSAGESAPQGQQAYKEGDVVQDANGRKLRLSNIGGKLQWLQTQ